MWQSRWVSTFRVPMNLWPMVVENADARSISTLHVAHDPRAPTT